MAEVLVQFDPPVTDETGRTYVVRICGREAEDGRWEGWIEFHPQDGGLTLRTTRETEQPNRIDLKHWATGLTLSYVEGALERAYNPHTPDLHPRTVVAQPSFDRPASSAPERTTTSAPHGLAAQLPAFDPVVAKRAALNPYGVYSHEGEVALRAQLSALDEAELRNIIRAYQVIDEDDVDTLAMHHASLVELIAAAVRKLYH
jgi:sulfur relay (sulfurtransferase) DsrF/TusC family protein